jgi:tripartite-type tricarboxylate transporter receptor subunit TctC
LIGSLVFFANGVGAATAHAEDHPLRAVHIVVPYAADGGTDAMARWAAVAQGRGRG